MECGSVLQVRLEGVYVITAAFLHANNARRKVWTGTAWETPCYSCDGPCMLRNVVHCVMCGDDEPVVVQNFARVSASKVGTLL